MSDTSRSMSELQAMDHGADKDYGSGPPHVTHSSIRGRIERDLMGLVAERVAATGRCRVIEVGAGHGTFTGTLLAAGAHVTVTEMSRHSVAVLRATFGSRPDVDVVHDIDGLFLAQAARGGFDVVVFVSVLHHIPDYQEALEGAAGALAPGGSIYTVQDPLWYPRRTRRNLRADRMAYLVFRLRRGNYVRGLATRARRMRGVYDESNPADMVEYHVVRQGVDDVAIEALLRPLFERVEIWRYWSTQSPLLQRIGERYAAPTTFGVIARGRREPAAGG